MFECFYQISYLPQMCFVCFFCAKYKIFPWCHYPSDMDWGEVAEMWTAAANTVLWYSKKKGRRRNKAICFHHPHTSALWTQSHLSLCCLHAADRISTRVILRIQSYQHALYISHAELLVLLHYCLLLSYLSLVGNSTGHCNDPGKTIQKWSESTFFPLPLSLPLLTAER